MPLMKISIVIPTYKRPVALLRCLEALKRQTTIEPIAEVIIIGDGFPAPEIEDMPFKLVIKNLTKNIGICKARIAGCTYATGELLGFLDDDSVPAPDWIEQGVGYMKKWSEVSAIVGRVHSFQESGKVVLLRQKRYEERFTVYSSMAKTREIMRRFNYDNIHPDIHLADFLSGNNSIVRRTAYESIGGLDPVLRKKHFKDFAWHLLSKSMYIGFNPGLVVQHDHHPVQKDYVLRALSSGYFMAYIKNKWQNFPYQVPTNAWQFSKRFYNDVLAPFWSKKGNVDFSVRFIKSAGNFTHLMGETYGAIYWRIKQSHKDSNGR